MWKYIIQNGLPPMLDESEMSGQSPTVITAKLNTAPRIICVVGGKCNGN